MSGYWLVIGVTRPTPVLYEDWHDAGDQWPSGSFHIVNSILWFSCSAGVLASTMSSIEQMVHCCSEIQDIAILILRWVSGYTVSVYC